MNEQKKDEPTEAVGVVGELLKHRLNGISDHGLNSKRVPVNVASIFAFIICIGLIFVGSFVSPDNVLMLPENRRLLLVGVSISAVIALLLIYYDFTRSGFSKFIRDPVTDILRALEMNIEAEERLYARLGKYSESAIMHARDGIARTSRIAESLAGLFVGSMTKVGIIPPLLAIAVAFTKIPDSKGFSVFEYIAYVMVGLYFLSFQVMFVSIKFTQYENLLDSYLSLNKSKGSDSIEID